MPGKKWIQSALKPRNRGLLHRELGVPMGRKLRYDQLVTASKSKNPKIARQARLAMTLRSFKR